MLELNISLTYLEILYITLSVCAVIITIFLLFLLKRLITFFGYINEISKKVSNLADLFNSFLIKPIQFLNVLIDYLGKFLDGKK